MFKRRRSIYYLLFAFDDIRFFLIFGRQFMSNSSENLKKKIILFGFFSFFENVFFPEVWNIWKHTKNAVEMINDDINDNKRTTKSNERLIFFHSE